MTGIVVFWNMMARIFFRNNMKREAAVSPKFWLIFTRATTSHYERKTLSVNKRDNVFLLLMAVKEK